ncbi:MAG TPA: hypothetical protein VKP69_19080 [Isosphaeraceae bacterium]|nr:hypothetical protein [Isosphaeraceae bacterium]
MLQDDRQAPSVPQIARRRLDLPTAPPEASTVEALADRLLQAPLAGLVVGMGAFQLATWVPHYLNWPWFADHDVFATLAQGWSAGVLPYRDLAGNNFPGTVYLFWLLGKAFGWGRTVPFYAADAGFVLLLGAVMLAWSRRRFGRILPGAIGYATFLSYYLGLDFTRVAQRDWHGPFFVMLGLLAVDGWPGRAGRSFAAAAAALGFAFRPQVVLLFPALALAVAQGVWAAPEAERSPARTMRALVAWGLLLAGSLALAFAPIAAAGIGGDFLRGVRLTFYGGRYNQVGLRSFGVQMLLQSLHLEFVIVPAALVVLASHVDSATRGAVRVGLTALLGAWLYKPLSPVPYPYLTHPIMLVWSLNVALLVALLSRPGFGSSALRLVAIALAIGLGVKAKPVNCGVQATLQAVKDLPRGVPPAQAPIGYPEITLDKRTLPYPWKDYRAALDYLRRATRPEERVANLLPEVPALTGPSGRLPALPAESLAWLNVKPDDEPRFLKALGESRDAVVVWAPGELDGDEHHRLLDVARRLAPAVRHHYQPVARFGVIEVWRKRAG